MKILIVDDDEMVRFVSAGMLEALGHAVVSVASGSEALQHLKTESEGFDLILLDELMPDMDGRATLNQLTAHGFRIPVVFCSGHARDRVSGDRSNQPVAWLAKPFTLDSLRTMLSRVQEFS